MAGLEVDRVRRTPAQCGMALVGRLVRKKLTTPEKGSELRCKPQIKTGSEIVPSVQQQRSHAA